MSDDDKLVEVGSDATPREGKSLVPAVGQWYWVKDGEDRWLGCIIHVGTNYVEVTTVGRCSERVHFDDFVATLTHEPNASAHIRTQVDTYQAKTRALMAEVIEVTRRLAIVPRAALPAEGEAPMTALAVVSGAPDVDAYKNALIKAKEEELPELFKQIEESNKKMAEWMAAEVIPLEAEANQGRGLIRAVHGRILNVELYAGLVEDVVQVGDGTPAAFDTPVHLMQRRHYMDEECLAAYRTGGMSFADISGFDQWLAEKENMHRILPHPRCVVAFRVRRNDKERDWGGDLHKFFRIIEERGLDRATFLYVRNGDQLFRLRTGVEFDEKLFPDLDHHILKGEKLYARKFISVEDDLITEGDFLARIARYEEEKAKHEVELAAWKKLPRAQRRKTHEPWWHEHHPSYDYEPFDPSSVYYDDISEVVQKAITAHNRIVVVLQGLLDRSLVLHPHPPWRLWTEEGFATAIRLVYDQDRVLTPGDKPDFEAYRARLNASLRAGSVTVGQEDAWERHEAKKENDRRDRSWRYSRGQYRLSHARPYGNPGPGLFARVERWSAAKQSCTYAWERERQRADYYDRSDNIRTTFTCSAQVVLNVDAYQPGDFKQFFADPRTRAEYLKWASLLLEAEEWKAGNRTLGSASKEEL